MSSIVEKRVEDILGSYERSLAQIILQCVDEVKVSVGRNTICDILRGSRSKKILQNKFFKNSMYGVLCSYNEDRVHTLIDSLIAARLLNAKKLSGYGNGSVLYVNRKGVKYLNNQDFTELGLTDSRTSPYYEKKEQTKFNHPQAYEKWSEEDLHQLEKMVLKGFTVEEIARSLERQPSVIEYKVEEIKQKSEDDFLKRRSRLRRD